MPRAAELAFPVGLTRFIVDGVALGCDQTISIRTASTADVVGCAAYEDGQRVLLPAHRVTTVDEYRVDLRLTDDTEPPVVTITGVRDGAPYRFADNGDGTFTYSAAAVDGAGNTGKAVATFRVIADDGAQVVPGVAKTRPNAYGSYRDEVAVGWTATGRSLPAAG